MKNVSDFLHGEIPENLRHFYEDPDHIVGILKQPKAIYQAIRSGDPEPVYKTMQNPINNVIRFFRNRR